MKSSKGFSKIFGKLFSQCPGGDWLLGQSYLINSKDTKSKIPSLANLSVHWSKIMMQLFSCYLVVPRPALDHYHRDSLTHPLLITVFLQLQPKEHQEAHNEVGSLCPTKRLVAIELVTL